MQKNGLKLDTATAAIKGGKTGAGIMHGKAADSLVVQTIEGTYTDISKMPYKHPPLDSVQTALLKQ